MLTTSAFILCVGGEAGTGKGRGGEVEKTCCVCEEHV